MGQQGKKEAVAPNASCTSRPGQLSSFPVTPANLSGSPPSTNSNTGSEEQTSTASSWSISHTRSIGDLLSIVFLWEGPMKTVLKRLVRFQGDESLWFGPQSNSVLSVHFRLAQRWWLCACFGVKLNIVLRGLCAAPFWWEHGCRGILFLTGEKHTAVRDAVTPPHTSWHTSRAEKCWITHTRTGRKN